MKNFWVLIIIAFLSSLSAFALDDFETPVPSYDDEVTSSGPNTKFSLATQMRFDAFQDAETSLNIDIPDDRKIVKIYKLSKNETYLQKVKIPNAKIIEYTNGSYDIKFKDSPFFVFNYNKYGELQGLEKITNKAKIPYFIYHYDTLGNIAEVEIKPDRYRSYIYDLDGVLTKFIIDDKMFSNKGKIIRRKKSFI